MRSGELDRCLGLMYGLVIGDALGVRYEFKTSEVVDTMIRRDFIKIPLINENFLPILGGFFSEFS